MYCEEIPQHAVMNTQHMAGIPFAVDGGVLWAGLSNEQPSGCGIFWQINPVNASDRQTQEYIYKWRLHAYVTYNT